MQIEGGGENFLDFDLVQFVRAGGGAGGGFTADVFQHGGLGDHGLQPILHERPGSAVARFFLHPDDFLGVGILLQNRLNFRLGEWIQLLDTDDGGVGHLMFFPAAIETEIDLATAQQQSTHAFARRVGGIVDHQLEGSLGQLLQ